MKVIMVCSGGMSSAMVVDSIKKQAEKENYDLEIKAVGSEEVGKPVDVVDPMGYTPIGAPKILKQIKGYDK